jgi:hypothetical protein
MNVFIVLALLFIITAAVVIYQVVTRIDDTVAILPKYIPPDTSPGRARIPDDVLAASSFAPIKTKGTKKRTHKKKK